MLTAVASCRLKSDHLAASAGECHRAFFPPAASLHRSISQHAGENKPTLLDGSGLKSIFAIEYIDHKIHAANTHRGEEDGSQCRK